MVDRLLLALALLAAAATVLFAVTRRVCPRCRTPYATWRALQRHLKEAHRYE